MAEPSPQLIATVWVSPVPGSVNDPDNDVLPSSLMTGGETPTLRFDGATLATWIESVAVPTFPALSVTVYVTEYVPLLMGVNEKFCEVPSAITCPFVDVTCQS